MAKKSTKPSLDSRVIAAVRMSGEIIRRDSVLCTFPTISIQSQFSEIKNLNDNLSNVAQILGFADIAKTLSGMPRMVEGSVRKQQNLTAEKWSENFKDAFYNKMFLKMLEETIAIAHRDFWKQKPLDALQFDGNNLPANTVYGRAITNAHKRLVQSPKDPRWITLAVFCFARVVAVNTKAGFDSTEWNSFTFAWFDIEKAFLNGNGKRFATMVLSMNRDYFGGEVAGVGWYSNNAWAGGDGAQCGRFEFFHGAVILDLGCLRHLRCGQ